MLQGMLKDTVAIIKSDGNRIESVQASIQRGKAFFADAKLPLEEGDIIERKLPSGLTERFDVVDRGFYESHGGIPAHFQARIQRAGAAERMPGATTIYNVSGPNARVNIKSVDSSTNVISLNSESLFAELRATFEKSVAAPAEREELVARVRDLEAATSTRDYLGAYQRLISVSADHMTLLAPFLTALAQLVER